MRNIIFRLHAEAMEVAGIGEFALTEHRHQITVGLSANLGNLVLNPFDAVRWEMFNSLQRLQYFDDVFKPAIQVSHAPVDMGPYRHLFGRFLIGVKVRALRLGAYSKRGSRVLGLWLLGLWLRETDRAFSFLYSHGCLLQGDFGQGAYADATGLL